MNNPKNNVCKRPINSVIRKINTHSNEHVFLAGDFSTGKTTILTELLSNNIDTKNPIINGTVRDNRFTMIGDEELFSLYYTCQLVNRMICYIKKIDMRMYEEKFLELDGKICNISAAIDLIYYIGDYKSKYSKIDEYICKNPQDLLDEFLLIAMTCLDYETITVVLDNFDSFGNSSSQYQSYMYNMLKNNLRIIATVSDKKVLYNHERRAELSKNGAIVEADYTQNVEYVKEILDLIMKNEKFEYLIGEYLTDEEIAIMIEKTNGNLTDMKRAVRNLYVNLKKITDFGYAKFMFEYIDNVIYQNPLITGHIMPIRRLYI